MVCVTDCHGVCRVVADDVLLSWCVSLTVMVCVTDCHGVCRVIADDDLLSWCVSLTVMVCVVLLQMMIYCHGVCH